MNLVWSRTSRLSLTSKKSSLTCNKACISHAACVVEECDVEECDVEKYESSEEAASCSTGVSR